MMNTKGFTIWRVLFALPMLFCLFALGFVSSDIAAGSKEPHFAMNAVKERLSELTGYSGESRGELVPAQAFQGVMATIERNYYAQPPKAEEMTYDAIRGMLGSLKDPYTRFMDPTEFKRMQEDTRGDFVGVGAQLDDATDGAKVVRPIPNSPAERAGVKAGDVIIAVDDKRLNDISLDEIVRLIRGQRGTKVKLTLRRDGEEKPIEVTITRDVIESPTVDVYLEDSENKIYRIWLQNFSEKAAPMLDQALRKVKADGGKGLILDLRYNPGGLLDAAIEVVSRFVPGQKVAVIVQRKQGEQDKLYTNGRRYFERDFPVVVLVNGGSASASEIVSGALRDYKVAPLIGETTFGKGLVQTVITTSQNTAVAITTAKYLTPTGFDLNRKFDDSNEKTEGGLKPDYEVKPSEDWRMSDDHREDDVQLQKAISVLREKIHAQKSGEGELRAQANEGR